MTSQPTLRYVMYQDYPIQYPSTASSGIEDVDIKDILDWMLFPRIHVSKKPFLYCSFLSLLETDRSSVQPHFEIKNETSLMEEPVRKAIPEPISEEDIIMEMLEHDFIARMPPKKRYIVELEIKKISKGEPRIVDPEKF